MFLVIIQYCRQQFSCRYHIPVFLSPWNLQRDNRRTKADLRSAPVTGIVNRAVQCCVAGTGLLILFGSSFSMGPQNQLQLIFDKFQLIPRKWLSQLCENCFFIHSALRTQKQFLTPHCVQLRHLCARHVHHGPVYRAFSRKQIPSRIVFRILSIILRRGINGISQCIGLHHLGKTSGSNGRSFRFYSGIQTIQAASRRNAGKHQIKTTAFFTVYLKEQFLKGRIPVCAAGTGLYLLFRVQALCHHGIPRAF